MKAAAAIQVYREQVLRWNRQINLVSRRESARRLDALIGQARSGLVPVRTRLQPGIGLLYCDLGAGGGIPGVIWHLLLRESAAPLESWLVEPRQKRAWFLERVARDLDGPSFGIAAERWGAGPLPTAAPAATQVLISLKALRLTDAEVLDGLAAALAERAPAPDAVLIARFHPPATAWTPDLAAELGIPPAGAPAPAPFAHLDAAGGEAVTTGGEAGDPVGLVLSAYRTRPG